METINQVLRLLATLSIAAVAAQNYAGKYKTQFSTQVLPPFNTAVATYQTSILAHVAGLTAEAVEKDPSALAKDLNCNTNKLLGSLRACVTSSNQLKAKMDSTVTQLSGQASQFQQQITTFQSQQRENQKSLGSLQAQVNQATDQVNKAKQALQRAQAEVSRKEQQLHESRYHCTGIFGGSLGKQVCSVANHGGIQGSKDALNRAQADANAQQARLAQLQGQLGQKQKEVNDLSTKISQVTAQRNAVTAQLQQVTAQRNAVTVVNTQVKTAEAKVSTFLERAEVLKTIVDRMVDFNALLGPLRSIADQLKAFNQQTAPLSVSQATMNHVISNLKLLQAKLPDYPFVENVPGC